MLLLIRCQDNFRNGKKLEANFTAVDRRKLLVPILGLFAVAAFCRYFILDYLFSLLKVDDNGGAGGDSCGQHC
jgi:hypothetical protein